MGRKKVAKGPELDRCEKPIIDGTLPPPGAPQQADEPVEVVDELEADDKEAFEFGSLTPEQREQKRLARKPNIDHLVDGTVTMDNGELLPLFDVGDTIVAERHISLMPGHPWLDTRVYVVNRIDDETGAIHCTDPEYHHYACIGYKSPFTRIKLCPKGTNPFKAPKAEKPAAAPAADGSPAPKKGRGRPKGSKNRPKDVIKQERQARREKRAA